jgi:hypothetical protein
MRLPSRSGPVVIALALVVSSIAAQNCAAQTSAGTSASNGGTSASIPGDLGLLIGKRVVVGRMALCTPKTYNVNLSYSGKTAKVVSFTRNNSLDRIKGNLRSIPPSAQETMTDLMKGGLVLFEFEDGTRMDNCGSIGWSTIAAQLELAPGETVSLASDEQRPSATAPEQFGTSPSSGATMLQSCPVSVTGLSSGVSFAHMFVDALTTSQFERQVDETIHNGQSKHYLDVRVHNDSDKSVAAFEFGAIYLNKMGDEAASTTYISQNTRPIRPGGEMKTTAMDRETLAQTGSGEVKVYVGRVRFDDGSSWQDDGTHSCSRTTTIQ